MRVKRDSDAGRTALLLLGPPRRLSYRGNEKLAQAETFAK